MAKAWLASLLSEMHREFLKPVGFHKDGRTFSRDREGYVERFNFQGSSWSSAAETVFYINVGVEFAEFEPVERDCTPPKGTHWASRIEYLVPSAPKDWRCGEGTDRAALKVQLAELVKQASDQILVRLDELRADYLSRTALRGFVDRYPHQTIETEEP